MNPKPVKARGKPETKIVRDLTDYLRCREWFVKKTHGSEFSSGFPDLFTAHMSYGPRWIETKTPEKYRFTPAQLITFPKMAAAGVGIWVLTAATEEEIKKLFGPPNWYHYLGVMK